MTLLNFLGLVSMIFTVWFTRRAYVGPDDGVGQSRRASIIEAWGNIIIGFTINFIVNLALLPLVGAHVTAGENFMLGWCYTSISIVRAYALRRWFNKHLHLFAARAAERLS